MEVMLVNYSGNAAPGMFLIVLIAKPLPWYLQALELMSVAYLFVLSAKSWTFPEGADTFLTVGSRLAKEEWRKVCLCHSLRCHCKAASIQKEKY